MKKKSSSKKCPECKGTGEWRNGKNGPMMKCMECDGSGEAQHFEMIFWAYDQFPFVLASRGFIRDDGTAFVPSYARAFRPLKVMSMKDGKQFKDQLDALEEERKKVLESLENGWRVRVRVMAPWAMKWWKPKAD